jgi:hypothetical protein
VPARQVDPFIPWLMRDEIVENLGAMDPQEPLVDMRVLTA